MTGVEIAGAVGDAMAAILAGVGIWASYGLGDHPEPDNPATRDGVYTKSKTEVLQDLVGIISAIGLAFALLTLVTGDPFGANTSVNLITYLDQKLNALSSPISPAYALCNVGLLILMTFRFYYFNARYLANTYGLNKLEREEWWGFLFPDIPFIMLEGLTFAAVGLVVNHAALFAAGLALGLLMDAFWNVLQLYNCRATLSDVVGPLRFRIDRFWGVGPDKPPYDPTLTRFGPFARPATL